VHPDHNPINSLRKVTLKTSYVESHAISKRSTPDMQDSTNQGKQFNPLTIQVGRS
jgi:hypothetical protein